MKYICIYQGKKYDNINNNLDMDDENRKIRIVIDFKKDNSYTELNDTSGRIIENKFYKWIPYEEVESFYKINVFVIYKGISFETMGMGRRQKERKTIHITTNNSSIGEKLNMGKYDIFTYIKKIRFDEVESVKIEKNYICGINEGKKEYVIASINEYFDKYYDNL